MDRHAFINELLYRKVGGVELVQHSPVLHDVWMAYGFAPGQQQDLLLNPHWNSTPAQLAAHIERRITGARDPDALDPGVLVELWNIRLAHNQGSAVARLTLRQLVRDLLPLTKWFQKYLFAPRGARQPGAPGFAGWIDPVPVFEQMRIDPALVDAMARLIAADEAHPGPDSLPGPSVRPTGHALWLVRVCGTLALAAREPEPPDYTALEGEPRVETCRRIVRAFLAMTEGMPPCTLQSVPLWNVFPNRRAQSSMYRSTLSVKADAARQLFAVKGRGIRWAIVDCGVDATHPAFRARGDDGEPARAAFAHRTIECEAHEAGGCVDSKHWDNHTRIEATYDFRRMRDLLSLRPGHFAHPEAMPAALQELSAGDRVKLRAAVFKQHGFSVDWEAWEPFLRVPHVPLRAKAGGARDGDGSDVRHPPEPDAGQVRDRYVCPGNPHGTHVAGIVAADWPAEDSRHDALAFAPPADSTVNRRTGMCPEITLYDLRVLDEAGGDEFTIMAALQFVRNLNERHDHLEIHGVNLSMSVPYKPQSFACGRTPVCEECERLVSHGVVVVAAAGNFGCVDDKSAGALVHHEYRAMSITDPGNAESVITVGATHRSEPHIYGVSYFSSRGPTADGRQKPDLVAPGEKIMSTLPGGSEGFESGTSMAAPHVSGAAALLLCRHAELIGRPQEVKRILCSTATDLGREHRFQGAGMLDVLRALQSI